jgi:ACDE family multidrug resistance protein
MENHEEYHRLYLNHNLQIIFAVTLMAVLGVSSVSPAFPSVSQALSIPLESIGILITAFTLPGVILTLPLGMLADRVGRKKVLVPSLFVFGIAGLACALVREFGLLILFRFIQGIGGASLGSMNVTIIGDLFSNQNQKKAMAYNSSVLSIGTALYPTIGGTLATFGWYFPFALPIIAIPIGFIVLYYLENPEPDKSRLFSKYIKETWVIMRNRKVLSLLVLTSTTHMVLYGAHLTYLPTILKIKFDAGPFDIGLILSALSFVTAAISTQVPKLVLICSQLKLLGAAFTLYAFATFLVPFIQSYSLIIIPIVIYGIAHGINIPLIYSLLASSTPLEYRAGIMSMNGMVTRIGQTIGPMFTGLAFLFGGISFPFIVSAILAFTIMVVISLILMNQEME